MQNETQPKTPEQEATPLVVPEEATQASDVVEPATPEQTILEQDTTTPSVSEDAVPVPDVVDLRTPEQKDENKKIKVLNISYDRKIFDPDSDVRQRIIEYGELFDEFHIIIFTLKSHGLKTERIGKNIWLYPTNSWTRWLYVFDAVKIAKKELTFKSNLRADIVSAQDPFEAGFAGLKIARAFNRRLQLQVHADFLSPYFKDVEPLNRIRVMIANQTLPHANCVRVVSKHMKEALESKYPKLVGRIDILPIYIDIPFYQNAEPKFDVHERYPQFNFIIVMVNRLTKEKNVAFAIKIIADLVPTYKKIGLIIVGEGHEKANLERLVKKLKVENNVIFEPWQYDVVSYYKTANLFLLTSTYEGYGRAPIEAAACGIPVVTSNVGITASIFKDKETAFICPVNDEGCFIQKIRSFIEHNEERLFFKFNVKEHIETLVTGTKEEYLRRFKEGMEKCFVRE